jgi:hypothetical protein
MHRSFLIALSFVAGTLPAQTAVRIDAGQARTALAMIRGTGTAAADSLWSAHARTAGYRRLHEREAAMGRAFTDSSFRQFLGSDTMRARADLLERTLESWENADFSAAESRARAFLPAGTELRATVYITIKPRSNSFVFDVTGNPAIFFFLDPARTGPQFANIAAHELHHIGYAAACRSAPAPDRRLAALLRWLSAFGEGWAMLAAAGGADVHPHAESSPEVRAEWERALAQAPGDIARLEKFYRDVLGDRIAADSVDARGFSFISERPQGPFYTVGWLMASTIARADGRAALVSLICDPVRVIRRYHELTRGSPAAPRWTDGFVDDLRARSPE